MRAALALLPIATLLTQAPAVATGLGPETSDCRSALLAGWTHCDPATRSTTAPLQSPSGDALESRIDRFLAAYGKPPRSAVRALLVPTDDNIRLMLHEQDMTIKNAAYVAQRLTALRESENRAAFPVESIGRPQSAATLAALMQIRTTLIGNADATTCRQFARLSEPLVRQVPELDLEVILTGQPDPVRLHACLAELPLAVPVSLAERGTPVPEAARIQLDDKAGAARASYAVIDMAPATLLAAMLRLGGIDRRAPQPVPEP